MKAMVLAAGFGSRLMPLTRFIPKPMFPVMNRPGIESILDLLQKSGVTETVINLHHLPQHIIDHFPGGTYEGMRLHFSCEPAILGTAGGIKLAQPFLEDDTFIVINSDILVDIDLREVIDFHKQKGSCLTLVLKPGDSDKAYDPIEIDETGRVIHLVGASSRHIEEFSSRVTFTGIQVMEPSIFNRIPEGTFCGTTHDIFPGMLEDGFPIFGFLYGGYWQDLGTPDSYLQIHKDLLDGLLFLKHTESIRPYGYANTTPPVFIGEGCHIDETAKVGPYTVLGNGCTIKEGAVVSDSVCWDGATVGAFSEVYSSTLGFNYELGAKEKAHKEMLI